MSSTDRRRFARRHLFFYMRVFDVKTGDLAGHVVDLNEGGLMVVSETEASTGEVYEFEMQLPHEMLESQSLRFTAECRWSKKDVNPDFYVAGFRIEEISDRGPIIIQKLVREFGFQEQA